MDDDFFKLIGDILYHIIVVQTPDVEEMNESDNRENDTINLVFNEDYCRKVLPFLKPDYFDIREERIVFEEITNFVDKYIEDAYKGFS